MSMSGNLLIGEVPLDDNFTELQRHKLTMVPSEMPIYVCVRGQTCGAL